MRLTTKGRYAVTAMLDLALHNTKGPISLADISKRQEISLSYLEQLFAKLRRAELVGSVRGPGGGYRLGRDAVEISIAEIVGTYSERFRASIAMVTLGRLRVNMASGLIPSSSCRYALMLF